MDDVEATPFIHVGVSEPRNESSLLISSRFAGCRSRQKVLVIGDKRLKIYPSYRSAMKTKKRRSHGTAYRGVPPTDTADTRLHGVFVVPGREPPESADMSGRSSENVSRTDDDETCRHFDDESDHIKPVRTEWKSVEEAVSDGIRRLYGCGEDRASCNHQDINSGDVLTSPVSPLNYDVESGPYEKAESVDWSRSGGGGVWLSSEDRVVVAKTKRRRRRNFVHSTADRRMDSTTTPDGRRCSKLSACLKGFTTFLFSTVGLTCLLVGYTIVGGLVFRELESERENQTAGEMERLRQAHLLQLWEMTSAVNVLHPDEWMTLADNILKNYTTVVYTYTKMMGWEAGGPDEESQWSFAGSLLYAITVITTIGYGHIAPKTSWGQIVTIVYAIFGIPLTLLTITNLGGFMATAFRFVYRNICCTLCCRTTSPPATDIETDIETASADHKNRRPRAAVGGRSAVSVTWWSTVRQNLTNTDDIRSVQVPITLSLLLIGSYLAVGALLFTLWERQWTYLVGFYFCFITLSTIGFGDYVPGTSLDAWASQAKLVLCALYLLVGLALLAMCFDLMQEQAKSQFRELGRRLHLIHSQEPVKR